MKYYTTTTEYNCGIDLHARQMYACVVDRQGKVLLHCNIEGNDFGYFLKRVAPWRHDLTVACECTFNWYWLADACDAAGIPFVLAHALYAAHIHGGKNKNDRIDSEKLAHLLRSNLIPPAYRYPAAKRPIRSLLRQRMSYVWSRAELMAKLSMNQTPEGMVPAAKGGHNRDVWQERILAQTTDPYHQLAVRCDMDAIRVYDKLIQTLDGTITLHAREHQNRDYNLLLSVPGIGPVLAMTILYEMDSVARFPTVKDFVSYCQLVKGSVASAGRLKGLSGGKMGNAFLANQIARAVYFMLQSGQAFDAERMVAHRS